MGRPKQSKATKVSKSKPTRRTKREDYEMEVLEDIQTSSKIKEINYQLNTKFKNAKQKDLFNTILDNRITFVKGAAGTGKTFIAIMAALHCLKTKELNIKKIVLTRPYIQSASQETGFIKGDLTEKIAPYFLPFYNNINKMVGPAWGKVLKDGGAVEDMLINFMRGDTFGEYDAKGNPIGHICIADEMQNSTVSEMRTYISRLGEGSKLIILGDSDQVDIKLKSNEKHGLDDAFDRFQGLDGVAFIEFGEEDIVRDKFLIDIMKRYKK